MTAPNEPPLSCHDCGAVIGPRSARTVIGETKQGDELIACGVCSKKHEKAAPPKQVRQLGLFGGAA